MFDSRAEAEFLLVGLRLNRQTVERLLEKDFDLIETEIAWVDAPASADKEGGLRLFSQRFHLGGFREIAEVLVHAEFQRKPQRFRNVTTKPSDSPGAPYSRRHRGGLEFIERNGDQMEDVGCCVRHHGLATLDTRRVRVPSARNGVTTAPLRSGMHPRSPVQGSGKHLRTRPIATSGSVTDAGPVTEMARCA